jgi:hypothetical protein
MAVIPKPIAVAIVCIVTSVWLANFAAQFLVTDYHVDGYLHTVFLIIVGGALGLSRKGKGGESDDKGAVPPPPTTPTGIPSGGPDDPEPPPDPEPPRASGAHRLRLSLLPRAAI